MFITKLKASTRWFLDSIAIFNRDYCIYRPNWMHWNIYIAPHHSQRTSEEVSTSRTKIYCFNNFAAIIFSQSWYRRKIVSKGSVAERKNMRFARFFVRSSVKRSSVCSLCTFSSTWLHKQYLLFLLLVLPPSPPLSAFASKTRFVPSFEWAKLYQTHFASAHRQNSNSDHERRKKTKERDKTKEKNIIYLTTKVLKRIKLHHFALRSGTWKEKIM